MFRTTKFFTQVQTIQKIRLNKTDAIIGFLIGFLPCGFFFVYNEKNKKSIKLNSKE